MAKIYTCWRTNQITQNPGWLEPFYAYCGYEVAVLEDEYQDTRAALDDMNAEVLDTTLARASLFADAYRGYVKLKADNKIDDAYPTVYNDDVSEGRTQHDLTADDTANAVAFNHYIFKRIIRDRYNAHFMELSKPASHVEKASWEQQKSEAAAWTDNNSASTPMLTTMATARSVTVEALVGKINAKVSAYNSAVATMVGEQKVLEDEVDALDTIAKCHKWRHEKGIASASTLQLADDPSISAPPTKVTF